MYMYICTLFEGLIFAVLIVRALELNLNVNQVFP